MTEETIAPSRAQLVSPAAWREAYSKQLQQQQELEQEMELEPAQFAQARESQAQARESQFAQESGQRELRPGENATEQFQDADGLQSALLSLSHLLILIVLVHVVSINFTMHILYIPLCS